jgi:hypothetical protein
MGSFLAFAGLSVRAAGIGQGAKAGASRNCSADDGAGGRFPESRQ